MRSLLYGVGGTALAATASGLGPFWDVTGHWSEPIFYQKLILWTVLLETLGVAGSLGAVGRPLQADDRRCAVLDPAQHDPAAALAGHFGDGHLHNETLINAIQKRCDFAPGEFVIAWVESQAIHENFQRYRVIDATLGVIERGRWLVADAVAEQPSLPTARSRSRWTGPAPSRRSPVRPAARSRPACCDGGPGPGQPVERRAAQASRSPCRWAGSSRQH